MAVGIGELVVVGKLVKHGWKIKNMLARWQNRPVNEMFQEWQYETLQHFAVILGRLNAQEDRTEEELVDALATRMSEQTYERIVFSHLLTAALAPSVGKMKMLSAFSAYVHYSDVGIGMLSRVGGHIAVLEPAEALLLRGLCYVSGHYDEANDVPPVSVPEFDKEPEICAKEARTCFDLASRVLASDAPIENNLNLCMSRITNAQLLQIPRSAILRRRSIIASMEGLSKDYEHMLRSFDSLRPMRVAFEITKALFMLTPTELVEDDLPRGLEE